MKAGNVDALELPDMPTGTGPALASDAAERALTENDEKHDDDDILAQDSTSSPAHNEPTGDEGHDPAPPTTGKTTGKSSKRETASADSDRVNLSAAAPPSEKPEKVTKRAAAKLKRAVLEDRYVTQHEELTALRTRAVDLERRAAVVAALGTDAAHDGVTAMVGELVDMLDAGAQLSVGRDRAALVKLDADERARLVKLGAPIASKQLGAYVESSPVIAFCLCAASIAFAKFVAFKMAQDARVTGANGAPTLPVVMR